MKGSRDVQSFSRRDPPDFDHRIPAAAKLVHRRAWHAELPRSNDESALPRAIRGCGLGLSARPGDRRARHCDRWRRAFRRADQRHELAELPADPYGRVFQGGDAQRLSDGRRRAAARPYPARLSRSPGVAADRRRGRYGNLQYAAMWKTAQRLTKKPVKFGTILPNS